MAIQAKCPHCEASIRAGDKYAGQQVKCPKCGKAMRVPAAAVAAPPAVAEPAVSAASGTPAGADDEGSIVRIGDDAEHWRKSVSKRPASRRASAGKPVWLWPAVGAVACAVLLGVGFAFWNQQPADEIVEGVTDAPTALAQTSPNAGPASSFPDESAAVDDPQQPAAELMAARDSEPAVEEPVSPPPADTSDTSLAAVPATTEPLEETAEPAVGPAAGPETDKPEMAANNGAGGSEAEASPAVAATDAALPETNLPPEEVFEERGLRLVGEQVALVDESIPALRESVRDAQKHRLKLTKAFAEAMKMEELQKNLKAEHGARSMALAQVNATRPNDVATNNLLVGQLNVIAAKVEQVDEALEKSRSELAEVRESYIEHLLKTRELVDGVESSYETLAADPQVKAALAKLSKKGDTEFILEPTGGFARALRDLESLEEQILSDTIAARVESGNLHVSTMINGEHTIEMVVDSGASIVTLPYADAVAAGLKPKETDPVIQLQIADGSLINGKLISIPSLRVGKFTVEDVEAAVLGPEAVAATPLLGMSFLSKFETKIDSQRGQLILSHIKGTEGSEKIR